MGQPTQETLERRRVVDVNSETVTNISSKAFPHHYPGEDHEWDLQFFKDNFHVQFHKNAPLDSVFSLIGIDASIANAIRRILIAEIPTLAIEQIDCYQNTSIIQDEVLAHRLGLIPLKGNKKALRSMKWKRKPTEDGSHLGDAAADINTVQLTLDVECDFHKHYDQRKQKGVTDPKQLYKNPHVYASQLKFEPFGCHSDWFSEGNVPIQPVHPNVLIAKLRPNQKITMRMLAQKGIGADHAKFSPVSTASYRLLPVINILKPIIGGDAMKFQECFPPGVIGTEKITKEEAARKDSGYEGHAGEQKAVVKDAIRDTVTRECLRHEEFRSKVKLGRQRDHFIFSVESTGQWDSDELVIDAIQLLKRKCLRAKRDLDYLRERSSSD